MDRNKPSEIVRQTKRMKNDKTKESLTSPPNVENQGQQFRHAFATHHKKTIIQDASQREDFPSSSLTSMLNRAEAFTETSFDIFCSSLSEESHHPYLSSGFPHSTKEYLQNNLIHVTSSTAVS